MRKVLGNSRVVFSVAPPVLQAAPVLGTVHTENAVVDMSSHHIHPPLAYEKLRQLHNTQGLGYNTSLKTASSTNADIGLKGARKPPLDGILASISTPAAENFIVFEDTPAISTSVSTTVIRPVFSRTVTSTSKIAQTTSSVISSHHNNSVESTKSNSRISSSQILLSMSPNSRVKARLNNPASENDNNIGSNSNSPDNSFSNSSASLPYLSRDFVSPLADSSVSICPTTNPARLAPSRDRTQLQSATTEDYQATQCLRLPQTQVTVLATAVRRQQAHLASPSQLEQEKTLDTEEKKEQEYSYGQRPLQTASSTHATQWKSLSSLESRSKENTMMPQKWTEAGGLVTISSGNLSTNVYSQNEQSHSNARERSVSRAPPQNGAGFHVYHDPSTLRQPMQTQLSSLSTINTHFRTSHIPSRLSSLASTHSLSMIGSGNIKRGIDSVSSIPTTLYDDFNRVRSDSSVTQLSKNPENTSAKRTKIMPQSLGSSQTTLVSRNILHSTTPAPNSIAIFQDEQFQ